MNGSRQCSGRKPIILTLVFFSVLAAAPAEIAVHYSISTEHGRRAISPYIYGTNFDNIKAENLAVRRIGGNRLTTYNWENNASNAGLDYIHLSNEYAAPGIAIEGWDVPGKMVTDFIDQNRALGAESLVALQMAGFVAADIDGPVTEAQAAPSARWKQAISKKAGPFCTPPDKPNLTDDVVYIDEFVNYLVSRYGNAAEGGVRFYAMDNEPALWSHTHPRIHPEPVTCRELLSRTIQLAGAVKDVDPHALTCGPALYGFAAFLSLQDAPDWNEIKEKGKYGWFVDFYLDAMRQVSDQKNRRLLDVLDVHWYPEAADADGVRVTTFEPTNTNYTTRMQTPRSLWDPDYREKSWIGDNFENRLPLLPELFESINTWYPQTKLAFTEYYYGGTHHISGGIAQADVLGIFGKYGVHMASYWKHEDSGPYADAAFRLYRNYDGKRSTFGDTAVTAAMSDKVNSSVYASVFSEEEGKLCLVVLNKNLTEPIKGMFRITSPQTFTSGRVWAFDADHAAITERTPVESIADNAFTYSIPPLTACHIVLEAQPSQAVQPFEWEQDLKDKLYAMAETLTAELKPWPVPEAVFAVETYGAVADGHTINTEAIQKAIDACSAAGGGVVRLAAGDYVTGTIQLKSGVMLEVAEKARLLGSTRLDDYPEKIEAFKSVMSENHLFRQSLIYAEKADRVGIRGKGEIYFRGEKTNFSSPQTVGPIVGRPFGIRMIECSQVVVQDILLHNAAAWMQSYIYCKDLIFDGMRVNNHANYNNDGLDVDGCTNVIVRNCLINSEDDAMCLKGCSSQPTQNVLIEDSTFVSTCNAFKIGTDTQGPFRNILARNLVLGGIPESMASSAGRQSSTGVTLATVDGGDIENVLITDIEINQARCPVFVRIGKRGRVMPGVPKPEPGTLHKVIIENVTGRHNYRQGSFISGIPGYNISDVVIRHYAIEMEGGGTAEMAAASVTENEYGYPDAHQFSVKGLPAYGFYVRHAENILLDDISVTPANPDARPIYASGDHTENIVFNGRIEK